MDKQRFFTVMVVGDNPEQLMEKYKIGELETPILKYKAKDKDAILSSIIEMHKNLLKVDDLTDENKASITKRLNILSEMTPDEYFQIITEGCTYDEEGNAYTTENPNGKWESYQKGNHFSVPLITKDGTATMSAVNKDINWKLLHQHNREAYELVWDMVKCGKQPTNEIEQQMYDNMKNRNEYMDLFVDKKQYVNHNTSYWNYAYLDENGWVDMDGKDSKEWVANFYDKFVAPLNPLAKITIFEFTIPI